MTRIKQSMQLAWSKHIAPNVLHVALKPSEEFSYLPGQFITLHFNKDDKEIKRSYSIANQPNKSEFIEFAISYQPNGVASEEIFHMNDGETVDVSGPAGRLVLLDNHPARYVLIATGTGVTPYRAMLDQISEIIKNSNTKFLLLFGVRNQAECLYFNEFLEFKNNNPNFDFQVYYSREMPSEEVVNSNKLNNTLHKGYVQTGFDKYNLDPEQDMIYLCGNPGMIDEAYNILQDKGFTAKTVRREKYISSK